MESRSSKDFFDNQVHGGMIVSENARNVFRAISSQNTPSTGDIELLVLLYSLPSDELSSIQPKLDAIDKKYESAFKKIQSELSTYHNQHKMQNGLREDRNVLKIKINLDKTQVVIDYLKTIGQWWTKTKSIPVSFESSGSENNEEHFSFPE